MISDLVTIDHFRTLPREQQEALLDDLLDYAIASEDGRLESALGVYEVAIDRDAYRVGRIVDMGSMIGAEPHRECFVAFSEAEGDEECIQLSDFLQPTQWAEWNLDHVVAVPLDDEADIPINMTLAEHHLARLLFQIRIDDIRMALDVVEILGHEEGLERAELALGGVYEALFPDAARKVASYVDYEIEATVRAGGTVTVDTTCAHTVRVSMNLPNVVAGAIAREHLLSEYVTPPEGAPFVEIKAAPAETVH